MKPIKTLFSVGVRTSVNARWKRSKTHEVHRAVLWIRILSSAIQENSQTSYKFCSLLDNLYLCSLPCTPHCTETALAALSVVSCWIKLVCSDVVIICFGWWWLVNHILCLIMTKYYIVFIELQSTTSSIDTLQPGWICLPTFVNPGHLFAHLEHQAGVLAGLSVQQCSLFGSSSEHKAQVPGRGDGHVVLQVPPKDTVAEETMWVRHHWDGS